MRNIDINEWLLNNNIDPLTEIVADGKQWFLSDILEEHLKEQFAIHDVVGQSEQLSLCKCDNPSPDIMYGRICVDCCLDIE